MADRPKGRLPGVPSGFVGFQSKWVIRGCSNSETLRLGLGEAGTTHHEAPHVRRRHLDHDEETHVHGCQQTQHVDPITRILKVSVDLGLARAPECEQMP